MKLSHEIRKHAVTVGVLDRRSIDAGRASEARLRSVLSHQESLLPVPLVHKGQQMTVNRSCQQVEHWSPASFKDQLPALHFLHSQGERLMRQIAMFLFVARVVLARYALANQINLGRQLMPAWLVLMIQPMRPCLFDIGAFNVVLFLCLLSHRVDLQ